LEVDTLRSLALNLPFVTEDFPFDEVTLVFRIGNKIFAILPLDAGEPSVSLKCDPEWAEELRTTFTAITPGYHLNKKHWNSVLLNQGLEREMIIKMLEHSYTLVLQSLPKKLKATFTAI